MTAKLLFESRLIYHVLRQEGPLEYGPIISLQLELTEGPKVYTSDDAIINDAVWSMRIYRQPQTELQVLLPSSCMTYLAGEKKPRCAIEVHQSAERYAATLEMFKGGYVSEITVVVENFNDRADYSKLWDTTVHEKMPIESICFEFPLPQSEA